MRGRPVSHISCTSSSSLRLLAALRFRRHRRARACGHCRTESRIRLFMSLDSVDVERPEGERKKHWRGLLDRMQTIKHKHEVITIEAVAVANLVAVAVVVGSAMGLAEAAAAAAAAAATAPAAPAGAVAAPVTRLLPCQSPECVLEATHEDLGRWLFLQPLNLRLSPGRVSTWSRQLPNEDHPLRHRLAHGSGLHIECRKPNSQQQAYVT